MLLNISGNKLLSLPNFIFQESASLCLSTCKDTKGCNYFTYNPDGEYCGLHDDCYNIDAESCPACITGNVFEGFTFVLAVSIPMDYVLVASSYWPLVLVIHGKADDISQGHLVKGEDTEAFSSLLWSRNCTSKTVVARPNLRPHLK
jgi:hypothetical protein